MKFAGDQMGVGVTSEEQDLKEKHADGPNTGAAAEPGENVFTDQRLDLKQEEGAEKNGQGIGGYERFQCAVLSL